MDPITIAAIISAVGGVGSAAINRPGKQQQSQRMRSFFGGPKMEEMLYNLLMSKMARKSMFQPSMLNPRMRNMLGAHGFNQSQMAAPSRGLITGGQ